MPSKKNPYTPDLGSPNTPTYIRPGVQEPNTAGIFANIAGNMLEGGIKMYENYETSKLIGEIDKTVMEYEAPREAERQATQDIGATEMAVDQTWEGLGEIPKDTTGMAGLGQEGERLTALEKNLENNVKKLVAARDQGRMSEADVMARVTKLTREAVTRNPWMEDQYYNSAQKYLKQSGIADVLDARIDAAKAGANAAEKYYNSVREEMGRRNLPYYAGMPIEDMQQAVNQERIRDRKLKMTEDILKGEKTVTELEGRRQLEGGGAYTGHNLTYESIQSQALQRYKAAKTPEETAAINAWLRQEGAFRVRQWRQVLGNNAVTDMGRKFLEDVDSDYKGLVESLSTAASGKEASAILETRLAGVKAIQELGLREKYNVPELNMSLDIIKAIYPDGPKMMALQGDRNHPLNKLLEGAVKVVSPDNAGTKGLQQSATNGTFTTIFDGLAKSQGEQSTLDTKATLGMAMATFNRTISTMGNPQEAYTFAHSVLASAAQNADNIRAMGQTPEYARQTGQMVATVMRKEIPDLVNISNQMIRDNNVPVMFDVLPTGSFVVKTGNLALDNKFAEKFGKNINNALDAYASSMGMSRKEASKDFYTSFFGDILVNDPDLAATPSTTTVPPGEFKIDSRPASLAGTSTAGISSPTEPGASTTPAKSSSVPKTVDIISLAKKAVELTSEANKLLDTKSGLEKKLKEYKKSRDKENIASTTFALLELNKEIRSKENEKNTAISQVSTGMAHNKIVALKADQENLKVKMDKYKKEGKKALLERTKLKYIELSKRIRELNKAKDGN